MHGRRMWFTGVEAALLSHRGGTAFPCGSREDSQIVTLDPQGLERPSGCSSSSSAARGWKWWEGQTAPTHFHLAAPSGFTLLPHCDRKRSAV